MLSAQEKKRCQEYLEKCKFTENDPGVIINWHNDALQQFVQGANNNIILPQPAFITTAPGNMTVTSLTNDLMNCLSRVSGGRCGDYLLAPNTLDQYGNIMQVLRDIEFDNWIQQQFNLSIPSRSYLGTVFKISDRSVVTGTPVGLAAPLNPRIKQIFQ